MHDASRREILAWSMYDFANSAFTTTVTTVVFSVYLATVVVPPEGVRILGMTLPGPTVWAVSYATSLALSGAVAPVIGAICDFSASKKRWLILSWLAGCLASVGLFFVEPGDWLLGAALYIAGNVAFESSVSLNNAFLPELAPPERLDRVSSIGWGIGYIGGGLCLLLNLLMIRHPDWFGIPEGSAVRFVLASVGLWWFVFALPCILWVRERSAPRPTPRSSGIIAAGFVRVAGTLGHLKRFRTLVVLTLSVLLFSAGVYTVLAMSGPFAGKELGFRQDEIVLCFLMIQGVGAVGSLLSAVFSSRVPTKVALYSMLAVWLAALCWALFMKTKIEFWMLGVVVGLVMGGTQSLSRGLQAQLTPPSATAEFFGFYGITQKIAAAGANYLFAAAAAIGGIRTAIASIMLLFLAGLWLLRPVDVATGRRESEEEEKRIRAGWGEPA